MWNLYILTAALNQHHFHMPFAAAILLEWVAPEKARGAQILERSHIYRPLVLQAHV